MVLTLRLLFHLPLRQAEGFVHSLFGMMGLAIAAPDHTTLSRRGQRLDVRLRRVPTGTGLHLIVDSTGLSIVGEGEWAAAKHGGRGQRGWKKLHLGVDRSGVIVAHALTDATVDDAATAIALINAVDGGLTSVTGDAAYDTIAFYETAAAGARPSWSPRPRRHACLDGDRGRALGTRTLTEITKIGRRRWKEGWLSSAGPGGERLLSVQIDHRRSLRARLWRASNRGDAGMQRPESHDRRGSPGVVPHRSVSGLSAGTAAGSVSIHAPTPRGTSLRKTGPLAMASLNYSSGQGGVSSSAF